MPRCISQHSKAIPCYQTGHEITLVFSHIVFCPRPQQCTLQIVWKTCEINWIKTAVVLNKKYLGFCTSIFTRYASCIVIIRRTKYKYQKICCTLSNRQCEFSNHTMVKQVLYAYFFLDLNQNQYFQLHIETYKKRGNEQLNVTYILNFVHTTTLVAVNKEAEQSIYTMPHQS